MILFPQMASTGTNRRANKYPYLVGQFDRQSGARSLLVDAPGRFSRRGIPHSSAESGGGANDLVEQSGKDSVIDLAESPVASQPCASRWQSRQSSYERSCNENQNRKRERNPEVGGQSVETSQESGPVRPAKRRRVAQAVEDLYRTASSSPIQPANKRRRRFFRDVLAESPTSKKPGISLSQNDEIEDSYEASRTLESSPFAHIVVEIPIYDDFDRDAYAKVSISSTGSCISHLETPYRLPAVQGDSSPSRLGEIIIPDSQELLGGSSTELSIPDTTRGFSVGRAGTCIPNSSNFENKVLPQEVSSPYQVSPGDYSANSAPFRLNSGLGFTEFCQGAQIVSSLEISASQPTEVELDFEIFQDETENQNSTSEQNHSQDTSGNSVLSQRDANSQRSGSQTKGTESTSLVSQSVFRFVDPLVIENVTAIENLVDSAEGESFLTLQRPLSPHLNLPHCLDTSGSNLPPRPHTPSDCGMAESAATSASSKTSSYAEMAMQARDKVRARFEMPPSGTNIEPLPLSPVPNLSHQMLPVRESIAGIPAMASLEESSNDEEQPGETAEISISLPPMKSTEHVILLPLAAMVRNVYKATITNRKRDIMAFLNSNEIDPRVLEQMDSMVNELKMLIDHQDLITDMSLSQSKVPDEHQAKWAETCSTKCLFLRYFLDNLRKEEKHIAILARPGRMLDILESILRVNRFMYERPDRPSQPDKRAIGPLVVTLLPTGLNGGQYDVTRADAVIAFDETFRVAERYSNILRTHLYEPGRLSPLISLVVAYSAEHLELCLPVFDDPIERKICLVNFIAQKRESLGELDEGLFEPQQAAAAVAQYLHFGGPSWPLPHVPDITGLKVDDPNHQQQLQAGLYTQSQNQEPLPAMTPHGPTKRTLRAESISGPDIDSTKRMRMTPTRGDVTSSGDITRVSDTVGHRTQLPPALTGGIAHEAIATTDTFDEAQSRQIKSILDKVNDLEMELENKQSAEEQLRSVVKSLEARLEDYVSTIRKLEPKLLQSIADRRKFQAERDAAKSQAVTVTQNLETRITEIAKLKEDKENLGKELTTARIALTNSAVPDIAQLAQTQEQLRTLQADKERLEKRIITMEKEIGYTRESYQKGSAYTTELQNELQELQEQNGILQRRASENYIRVAEIQRANEAKEREERIDELEALLKDREQELRKKSEELKFKTNGRRETRGTSVPRSPRMGSGAMSPRPRFAQPAGGSRGGSPAPGDAREGFRDATLFPSSFLRVRDGGI